MSDSDSDGDGTAVLGNWRSLNTAQKNQLRQQIAAWLGENYTSTPGVLLLMELVYQHYTHFCSRHAQHNSISQKVFSKILMENYPNVRLEQLGKRGKSSCFFVDLDIQEGSDEFDSVSKGRRLQKQASPCASEEPPAKRLKQADNKKGTDSDGGEGAGGEGGKQEAGGEDGQQGGRGEGRHREGEGVEGEAEGGSRVRELSESGRETVEGVVPSGEKKGAGTWRSLTSEEKETHRQDTATWLGEQYEVAPQICVLRTGVYHHYTDHCHRQQTLPAPQAIFGRLVQKTFPRVAMRRLGVRGESKYFYMGIDIRSTSDNHATVSADRVVCMESKPKNNRVTNGR